MDFHRASCKRSPTSKAEAPEALQRKARPAFGDSCRLPTTRVQNLAWGKRNFTTHTGRLSRPQKFWSVESKRLGAIWRKDLHIMEIRQSKTMPSGYSVNARRF